MDLSQHKEILVRINLKAPGVHASVGDHLMLIFNTTVRGGELIEIEPPDYKRLSV